MGAGAGVLCGGRPRLHLQCVDIRMAWCNGLIINAVGEVENVEAVESEEIEIDYDYQVEPNAVAEANVYWIAREWDRN